jgi:hypothetical protein
MYNNCQIIALLLAEQAEELDIIRISALIKVSNVSLIIAKFLTRYIYVPYM